MVVHSRRGGRSPHTQPHRYLVAVLVDERP